jgi:hypothetical protein
MNKRDEITITENFSDILFDTPEVFIDSLLHDGILKELPFVRTLIGMYKTSKQIIDVNYLMKLQAFIYGFKRLSIKSERKIISKLNDGKEKDIGANILLIIDRVESTQKAELIGKLFRILINNEIYHEVFLRLCHMIDKIYYDDLLILTNIFDDDGNIKYNPRGNYPEGQILSQLGIVKNDLITGGWIQDLSSDNVQDSEKEENRYQLTYYGKIVMRLLTEEVWYGLQEKAD